MGRTEGLGRVGQAVQAGAFQGISLGISGPAGQGWKGGELPGGTAGDGI